MYEILNIRKGGFATNSSSMHCLIFTGGGADLLPDKDDGYGRQMFILHSLSARQNYVASQIHQYFSGMSKPLAQALIKYIVGVDIPESELMDIDHQSAWSIPYEYNGYFANLDYLKEMTVPMLGPDATIVSPEYGDGGDLDDFGLGTDEDYFQFCRTPFSLGLYDASKLVCRKESSGYWVVFNKENGEKYRIRWYDDVDRDPATGAYYEFGVSLPVIPKNNYRADTPELVDMKITDFCPYGCEFCYQDSTLKGKHADTQSVKDCLLELSGLKVFEVAFGGGEPTLHPDFTEILEYTKSVGIVPNFTTRNLTWLKDPKNEYHKYATAFAYSVSTADDVNRLDAALDGSNWRQSKSGYFYDINIHVVMGTVSRETFRHILSASEMCGFRVTLLGWKNTGRGVNFTPQNYDWWLEECQNRWINVDTVMIRQYEQQLKNIGVDNRLYTRNDGEFSAYIDAVKGTMHRSSFDGSQGKRITKGYGGVLRYDADLMRSVFQGWRHE